MSESSAGAEGIETGSHRPGGAPHPPEDVDPAAPPAALDPAVPPAALDPLDRALVDRHEGREGQTLRLRFDHGEVLDVPVTWFFRSPTEMDEMDRAVLEAARGRVLDVGGGTGVHALPLQEKGREVTVLETLPGAVRILRERGVRDVREVSVWAFDPPHRYDTVLALMNGTGIAGTFPRLVPFLTRLRELLADGGQILLDSTDPGPGPRDDGRHPGEVQIQLEYGGLRGQPFPHLYVDARTLGDAAGKAGLVLRVMLQGEEGRFLARLRPVTPESSPAARRRRRNAPGARP